MLFKVCEVLICWGDILIFFVRFGIVGLFLLWLFFLIMKMCWEVGKVGCCFVGCCGVDLVLGVFSIDVFFWVVVFLMVEVERLNSWEKGLFLILISG